MAKHLSTSALRAPLEAYADELGTTREFVSAQLETQLRSIAETHGLKAGALIHATRVAVTGRAASPGLFEVLELIGREKVVTRLRHALTLLPNPTSHLV